jgi:hypothetical protein
MNARPRRLGWKSLVAAGALVAGAVVGGASPASATDLHPCVRPQIFRSSHWVQICPLWRGQVPVYSSPDHGNGAPVVGYLVNGGVSNWFVGDRYRSRYTYGRYYNHWWAYTEADNGRWGWVPEVFFSGGGNDEW